MILYFYTMTRGVERHTTFQLPTVTWLQTFTPGANTMTGGGMLPMSATVTQYYWQHAANTLKPAWHLHAPARTVGRSHAQCIACVAV